ncbi:unnamed protein product, partial [Closterium sp. Naga37s-1]
GRECEQGRGGRGSGDVLRGVGLHAAGGPGPPPRAHLPAHGAPECELCRGSSTGQADSEDGSEGAGASMRGEEVASGGGGLDPLRGGPGQDAPALPALPLPHAHGPQHWCGTVAGS